MGLRIYWKQGLTISNVLMKYYLWSRNGIFKVIHRSSQPSRSPSPEYCTHPLGLGQPVQLLCGVIDVWEGLRRLRYPQKLALTWSFHSLKNHDVLNMLVNTERRKGDHFVLNSSENDKDQRRIM